jgi:hypothetical protein
MSQKKLFAISAAALLALAFVIVLTQAWGIPLKDAIVGIVVYTLYGLLVVIYFLRCALIFLGVFAFYRILRERYHKQIAV